MYGSLSVLCDVLWIEIVGLGLEDEKNLYVFALLTVISSSDESTA